MKRFYRQVTVAALADGLAVTLDDKPMKTPAGNPLRLATPALAGAVAAEWEAQTGDIVPDTMPMTRLAATTLDRVAPRREALIADMVSYSQSDLLCYRSDQPGDLLDRQNAAWGPWLVWAEAHLGLTLTVTAGLMPVDQPPESAAAAQRFADALQDFELTALVLSVPPAGSFVLGAAFVAGQMTAAELFALSQLDETFQIELWGEDSEATLRREALMAEFSGIERFLRLSRS